MIFYENSCLVSADKPVLLHKYSLSNNSLYYASFVLRLTYFWKSLQKHTFVKPFEVLIKVHVCVATLIIAVLFSVESVLVAEEMETDF